MVGCVSWELVGRSCTRRLAWTCISLSKTADTSRYKAREFANWWKRKGLRYFVSMNNSKNWEPAVPFYVLQNLIGIAFYISYLLVWRSKLQTLVWQVTWKVMRCVEHLWEVLVICLWNGCLGNNIATILTSGLLAWLFLLVLPAEIPSWSQERNQASSGPF